MYLCCTRMLCSARSSHNMQTQKRPFSLPVVLMRRERKFHLLHDYDSHRGKLWQCIQTGLTEVVYKVS